jgi:hypothetical protein
VTVVAYCDAYDVAVALNIAGAQDDGWLTTLADSASRWVDAHCAIPFGGFAVTADGVRSFDPCAIDDGELRLDVPLVSLTSLTNGDGTAIDKTTVRLYPLNGGHYWSIRMLTSGPGWQWVQDGLFSVTGKWGWSATVPTPVKEATIMLAAWLYKRYQAGLQDAANNVEIGQMMYSERMPKQVVALLAPFRIGQRLL